MTETMMVDGQERYVDERWVSPVEITGAYGATEDAFTSIVEGQDGLKLHMMRDGDRITMSDGTVYEYSLVVDYAHHNSAWINGDASGIQEGEESETLAFAACRASEQGLEFIDSTTDLDILATPTDWLYSGFEGDILPGECLTYLVRRNVT